jgi:LEA14-like dessication related protein
MLPRRPGAVWLRCACAAAGFALAACAPHFEKPTLAVAKVDYRGGNLLQQDFGVHFTIHNPNTRDLPVAGIEAQLQVDGDRIASGATDRGFVVPAQGDGEFDMAIHADMATGLLKLLGHHDALPYELTGKVRIDLPMLRSLPFRTSGVLKLNN